MLKSNFGVEDGDTDTDVTDKVKRGLAILGIDEASTLPYLLELLSVKDSGIDSIPMSPAAKKDRILLSLQRLVVKGSERKPLVLAFEDLHWMDKSSEESAKHLLESIPRARILMIFTYRPSSFKRGEESPFIISSISTASQIEKALPWCPTCWTAMILLWIFVDLILEKTEGVPFLSRSL